MVRRGIAILAAGLMLVSGAGLSAQSLGEVAKKERERRSQLADSEEKDVIGNRELAEAEGGSLSIMGRGRSPGETPDEATEDEEGSDESSQALSATEVRELRSAWNRIWLRQLEAAERELDTAKDALFQCQSASHYVYVPLAVDCEGVYERVAIAEWNLRRVRDDRYNWELLLPEPPTDSK